jgi:hypothetical protein
VFKYQRSAVGGINYTKMGTVRQSHGISVVNQTINTTLSPVDEVTKHTMTTLPALQ